MTFTLASLDQFKAGGFPAGYPTDRRTFFSPVDQVHGVLKAAIGAARHSLVVAMYGFDDPELADIIHAKMADPHCYVQLTLDKSQASGVHEAAILNAEQYPATNIAIGHSEVGGAIMHMKAVVIDGAFVISGSTNWSSSGESKQDNQLTISHNLAEAAEYRSRIDAIHANMLRA